MKRARDLNFVRGGQTGPLNAITDVPGVEVGLATLISGDGPLVRGSGPVRTGVTVVLPLGRAGLGRAVAAGVSSFNGNGEMTGVHWIKESGSTALPIAITNTHAVGDVHRGVIDWAVQQDARLSERWLMPVVAETWDGYLNDLNGRHVTTQVVAQALEDASTDAPPEGSVGGGTGMNCYAFKGGTGTASRVVTTGEHSFTVGVLTQANFGSRRELTIRGVRVGELLTDDNPLEDSDWMAPPGAGSCITVVATDAPLMPHQCTAMARRVALGLARTGTTGSHFSGDLFLAFSTANPGVLDSAIDEDPEGAMREFRILPWGLIDPLYAAVVEATEEAVLNALVAARTMIGRDGHRSPAMPHDRVAALLNPVS